MTASHMPSFKRPVEFAESGALMRRLRLTEQHETWMLMSTLLALCSLSVVGLVVLPLSGPRIAALAAAVMLLGIFTVCYLVCVSGGPRPLVMPTEGGVRHGRS